MKLRQREKSYLEDNSTQNSRHKVWHTELYTAIRKESRRSNRKMRNGGSGENLGDESPVNSRGKSERVERRNQGAQTPESGRPNRDAPESFGFARCAPKSPKMRPAAEFPRNGPSRPDFWTPRCGETDSMHGGVPNGRKDAENSKIGTPMGPCVRIGSNSAPRFWPE